MSFPHPTAAQPATSATAIVSLALGVIGALATPVFGLFTTIPAAAAVTGAVAMRLTHTRGLRGRALALWGFWLGVGFFLLDWVLILIGIWGMRMGA